MNESQSVTLEALKIVTEFISSNSIEIVILVLLLVCRKSLSNLISRITSLTFKNGGSELGVEAFSQTGESEHKLALHTEDERPSSEDKEEREEKKEAQWLPDMYQAFNEGRIEDAEEAFRRYLVDETDEVKLEENRAFYFYLRFEKGQDNSAIDELKKLSRIAKTEDSKFNTLMWLSFCLRDGMQFSEESEVWREALAEATSELLKTTAVVNLAGSLVKEELSDEAKSILIDRLQVVEDGQQIALLYGALSEVEGSLGNRAMLVYCKDKSLEFDVNNREELFSSAYSASEEGFDDISISNYIKLVKIDESNSTALNNLGVRAQDAGLKIKAVDRYKSSAKLNNTLSMANQGYLLLGAGFAFEAEEIARNALKQEEPHQNVYRLLAEIEKKKEQESIEWEKLSNRSLSRQKQIREYTEQYYFGDLKSLEGEWYAKGKFPATVTIVSNRIEIKWTEVEMGLGKTAYMTKVVGKVSGSTVDGIYSRKKQEGSVDTVLGIETNKNIECIGYVSENGSKIKVISKSFNDGFDLCLSRKRV